MTCECNSCGLVFNGTPGAFPDVLDIIAAGNIVAGWDAADLSASPVALWPDASGNGFDLTAVGAAQPTWSVNAGPNGNPAVLFDGVDDRISNVALDLPAPGTTPTYYWGIVRQITHTALRNFWQAGPAGSALAVGQFNPSPNVVAFNGAAVANNNMPLTTYRLVQAFFNNALTDYLQIGSLAVTGIVLGNTDPGASFFLGSAAIGGFANIEVCELWIFNFLPSAAQLASLEAYARNRYGAGLV